MEQNDQLNKKNEIMSHNCIGKLINYNVKRQ